MKAIDVDEHKPDEINDVTAFTDIRLRTHHNSKKRRKNTVRTNGSSEMYQEKRKAHIRRISNDLYTMKKWIIICLKLEEQQTNGREKSEPLITWHGTVLLAHWIVGPFSAEVYCLADSSRSIHSLRMFTNVFRWMIRGDKYKTKSQ